MNKYEFAILYHPDLEVDLSKTEDKVQKIIADNGGKILKTDNWGKRRMAYKIKGHEHAVYVFYEVEMPGANVHKTESILNITDEVIRLMIVKPDEKAIAKAEAVKAKRKGREDTENNSTPTEVDESEAIVEETKG